MTGAAKSLQEPRIAVVCGDDRIRVCAFDHDPSRIVPLLGNNDSRLLLDAARLPWARFHLTPSYFRRRMRWRFDRFDVIWNTISDADVNPHTLKVAETVLAEAGLPVINQPGAVRRSTRDQVSRRLQGVPGLVVPRTLRWRGPGTSKIEREIAEGGLKLPIILRRAGSHTGDILGVCYRIQDLAPLCEAHRGELYATEFVDYRSEDGLYRKWRFFFMGQRTLLRHVLIADRWKINAEMAISFMRSRPECCNEERHLLDAGVDGLPEQAKVTLSVIRQRLGLDYFGLDCGRTETGEFLLFEANATMNFFPLSADPIFAYRYPVVAEASRAAADLLQRCSRQGHVDGAIVEAGGEGRKPSSLGAPVP